MSWGKLILPFYKSAILWRLTRDRSPHSMSIISMGITETVTQACPCWSKLYLATRQVLDSLVTCVHIVLHFGLQAFWLQRVLHSLEVQYIILEINQVLYIFNRNLHTFSKWIWYAIWISWMRVKKFPSEVLKIATVLQLTVDRQCWKFNWESKNRLLRAFCKE